jgi:hypothetical protein
MITNLEVKAMPIVTPYDIDIGSVTREATGNVNSLIHNAVRGKNWLGGITKLPEVRDDGGLIFLTKPDFNLAASNVGGYRHFSPLLNTNQYSIGALLRDSLDPRSVHQSGRPNSALNDPLNPFLSIIDNSIITASGWPDFVINEYVSNPGKRGSSYGVYSGTIQDALKFELSLNNQNFPGNLVTHLISNWIRLGAATHKNIYPHEINVWKDQLSYSSRFYRFVFNETGSRLSQFTMCGYSYPRGDSTGAVMDYDANQARNQGYDEVSSSWSCFGVYHNDPIVIDEFNRTVSNFNVLMQDGLREEYMALIGGSSHSSRAVSGMFNGYGYPRIHPRTLEFEIWVPKNQFALLSNNSITSDIAGAVKLKMISDYDQGILELSESDRARLFA